MRFRAVLLRAVFFQAVALAAIAFGLIFIPGDVTLRDLRFKEAGVSIPELRVIWDWRPIRNRHLTFRSPRVLIGEAEAREAMVVFKRGANAVAAKELVYHKLRVDDAHGAFVLHFPKSVEFDRIRAIFAGQEILGTGTLGLGKPVSYRVSLLSGSVPAQSLIEAFEWDKKISVRGVFRSRAEIEGSGKNLSRLDGEFDAAPEGGEIVILDQSFLQKIADSTKQPVEIVRSSFEHYVYNNGRARVSLAGKDLRLDLSLEGDAGKRNLEVNLHDLFSS